MVIAIGSDHAGFCLKQELIEFIRSTGHEVVDCGCYNEDSVDYPDIAVTVADKVLDDTKSIDFGVLICGTGVGISIAANKINGIRAALCHDHYSAKYTRLHNDSNIICFGARVIGSGLATELLDVFLTTDFEGGRHKLRVDKIINIEKNQEEQLWVKQ